VRSNMRISWQGTESEYLDLTRALGRNCECEFASIGTRRTACSAHRMLADDQRALNGLLFARRIAERLRDEEWLVGRSAQAARGVH
jgi:hypothetical protein